MLPEEKGRVNVSVDFPDLTAIKDQLKEHGAEMKEQGLALARMDENLKNITRNLNGRIPKLEEGLQTHDRQISRWQGALGILTLIVLILGGIVAEQWHSYSSPGSHEAPDGQHQPR